jgi:hypothetical protein
MRTRNVAYKPEAWGERSDPILHMKFESSAHSKTAPHTFQTLHSWSIYLCISRRSLALRVRGITLPFDPQT